jgi:hypothetical protein
MFRHRILGVYGEVQVLKHLKASLGIRETRWRADGDMHCYELSIVSVLTSATELAGHGGGLYPEHRGPADMRELEINTQTNFR